MILCQHKIYFLPIKQLEKEVIFVVLYLVKKLVFFNCAKHSIKIECLRF